MMKRIPSSSYIKARIEQAARASQRRMKQRVSSLSRCGRVPSKAEIERLAREEQRRIESDLHGLF
jgi:transposase-like protein